MRRRKVARTKRIVQTETIVLEGGRGFLAQKSIAPRRGLRASDVVDVVAERDEQVKEQLAPAVEHLQLHGAAALEGRAAADDEREVVGAQLGVCIGRVGVSIPGGREDGAALDAGLCSLELVKCCDAR